MASHTTTGEWKSFELRMRRRRAERLLLRARTAADAGRLDEANDCVEELRHLAPGMPGIAAVEQKLSHPQPPTIVARSVPTRLLAGAVAIVTGLVVTAAAVRTRPAPLPTASDLRGLTLSVPVEAGGVRPIVSEPAATTTAAHDNALPDVATYPAAEAPSPMPLPPPDAPRRDTPAAVPASFEVPATATMDLPGAPARVSEPTVAPSATTPSVASPPPVAVPRADETTAVRGVLDRYAAAYTSLDAAAARQVWPGVDEAMLARAFDGLASQRVSLGDCRIDVTGETARASCAGASTWAPKVGDTAPRTDRRAWSFDLTRAGGDWRILSARVQNR